MNLLNLCVQNKNKQNTNDLINLIGNIYILYIE